MTASTTMCNAGSPPYGAVFMISAQSIKVSMKKKKEKKRARTEEGRRRFIGAQVGLCAPAVAENAEGRKVARVLD